MEKTSGTNLHIHCQYSNTVEPPIVDPPRKRHCMLDISIKDIHCMPKVPKKSLSLYIVILGTSEKRTTSQ